MVNIKTFLIVFLFVFSSFGVISVSWAGKDKSKSQAGAQQAEGEEESLDVTIEGTSKDAVLIEKEPPPVELPFEDVVGFSRDGQTDRVLEGPVEHMAGEQATSLIHVKSRQTILPLSLTIPSAPFFHVEIPPGLKSFIWELQVVDENNKLVGHLEGTTLPKNLVEWDGFDGGVFKVRVGPAYTPVLIVTDERDKKQRYFGESVQLHALQYEQDGLLHLEFGNDYLFETGSARFSREIMPLLKSALNIMRQYLGAPFRITIYDKAASNVPLKERKEKLKTFFQNSLMIEPQDITISTAAPKDRGSITEIMMLAR